MQKMILKLLGFNVGLALADIVLLAGFDIWSLNPNEPLHMAATATIIFLTIALFGYVNYSILTPKEDVEEKEKEKENTIYVLGDAQELRKYVEELRRSPDRVMMAKDIDQAATQVEDFLRKVSALNNLLRASFEKDAYLYMVQGAIDNVSDMLRSNIISILRRLAINDETEYMRLKAHPANDEVYQQKMMLFDENMAYVKEKVRLNDEMLLQFDRLMNEVSRMNDSEENNDLSKMSDLVNSMKAMREMNEKKEDDMADLKHLYDQPVDKINTNRNQTLGGH